MHIFGVIPFIKLQMILKQQLDSKKIKSEMESCNK